jgi:integrase
VLADSEIKSFWSACGFDPVFGPFYQLLLLTAQRREEVSDMRWAELDLLNRTWTIPKERTKNGKQHLVHLSTQAVAIIEGLERRGEFLFATTGKAGLRGYGSAKARLDKHMNPDTPWRVHDLRRTAASGMAALGFQPHIIERVLNHLSGAQGGLVSVYQRFEYLEERKRALEAWGSHVEGLITERAMAQNVVAFRA